mmetsp:Transcript_41310/g.96578  ORF Transcript_41310/g.96578 Transcript_41310/m.96578 type:complete len:226 (+) Transcript_41310:119-796(+)
MSRALMQVRVQATSRWCNASSGQQSAGGAGRVAVATAGRVMRFCNARAASLPSTCFACAGRLRRCRPRTGTAPHVTRLLRGLHPTSCRCLSRKGRSSGRVTRRGFGERRLCSRCSSRTPCGESQSRSKGSLRSSTRSSKWEPASCARVSLVRRQFASPLMLLSTSWRPFTRCGRSADASSTSPPGRDIPTARGSPLEISSARTRKHCWSSSSGGNGASKLARKLA